MSEYISREAALEAIENCVQIGNTAWTDKYAARARIDDIPAADVVEVVRCKDCKWLVKSEGVCYLLSNYYEPPVYVEDDHYCSMGIMKGRC